MSKRMRLPNGFGQITKINNKRLRKPYRAMVTTGKTSDGKFIRKILKPTGYFKTYNEAYQALMEYNKNPYDISTDMTVLDVYNEWVKKYQERLTASGARGITSAWAHCKPVYNLNIRDLRVRHIKLCMEAPNISKGTANKIKSLFNMMLDYALEYELIDKNYARMFKSKIKYTTERSHIAFTDEELRILWKNINFIPYTDLVIIQCYTGFRPQELGLIRIENVDLDKRIIKGGMKTAAGTNRIVPINMSILPLVKNRLDQARMFHSDMLFITTDSYHNDYKLTYQKYKYRFEHIRDSLKLNPKHRAHDPRKTFVTLAKKFNLDEYAIKYIVGHTINDITENVYTERNIEWLVAENDKIKIPCSL